MAEERTRLAAQRPPRRRRCWSAASRARTPSPSPTRCGASSRACAATSRPATRSSRRIDLVALHPQRHPRRRRRPRLGRPARRGDRAALPAQRALDASSPASPSPPRCSASFVYFYAFGFTLNTLTLMALSLSIGMLIDDAIVVLENVYRHMEQGGAPAPRPRRPARDEIGLAVVATTLALCAVFVPIAFMGGVVGRFFREFGLVATCAVLTSMLVALTLTPMLCARYLRVEHAPGRAYRRARARLPGARGALPARAGRRPAPPRGGGRPGAGGGGRRARRSPRRVPIDFLGHRGSQRVQRLAEAAARQHASSRRRRRSRSASKQDAAAAGPEVRVAFTTIGGGVKKRVNEALIYVQLVHKSERRARASGADGRACASASARSALPVDDFAVEEVPLHQRARRRAARSSCTPFRGPGHRPARSATRRELVARLRAARRLRRPLRLVRDRQARDRARHRRASAPPTSACRRCRSAAPSPRCSPASRRRPSRRAASATTCASRCGPSTATTSSKLELLRMRSTRRRAHAAAQPGHAAHRQRAGADRPREPHPRRSPSTGTSRARRRGTADEEVAADRRRARHRPASTSSTPVGPVGAPARDDLRGHLRLRPGADSRST